MLYGMYVSAAGALANSYRQDVIANNLANVETVGFKRDLALLTARPTEAAQRGQRRFSTAMLEQLGGGIFALPTHTDFSPGPLQQTDNEFDLALTGKGFFQVRDGEETHYTRDGRFARGEGNLLVTLTDRYPVLDEAGAPIALDPDLDFVVDEAGQISQNGEAVARLGIVDFEKTSDLRKLGGNRYAYEGSDEPQVAQPVVKQKVLEGSGVVPMKELVEMIKAQRMFQSNVSLMQMQDEMLGQVIRRFGNLSG